MVLPHLSSRTWARTHGVLTWVWALAVIPTVLWWSESVLWVGLITCWANFASHWGAWHSARSEEAK